MLGNCRLRHVVVILPEKSQSRVVLFASKNNLSEKSWITESEESKVK